MMLPMSAVIYSNGMKLVQLKTLNDIVRLTTNDGDGPSLIDQLRESVENNTNAGGKGSGTKSRVLISADAFDLLNALELEWTTKNFPLESGFSRAYNMMFVTNSDLNEWIEFSRSIESVVNQINSLLNPGRRLNLTDPCPTCCTLMTHVVDSTGEEVQRYALVLDTVNGCTCLSCGAHWPVTELENLARELGCAPLPA